MFQGAMHGYRLHLNETIDPFGVPALKIWGEMAAANVALLPPTTTSQRTLLLVL